MGKTLQLLRHAKSDWDNAALHDEVRPLAKRGRRDIKLIAAAAEERDLASGIDLVVCSPTQRTRETLDGFRGALAAGVTVVEDPAIYGGSRKALLKLVQDLPDSAQNVLLIGHNPGFHDLASELVDRDQSDPAFVAEVDAKFPTAALATFEFSGDWTDVAPGAGVLTSYVRPRELR